MITLCPEFRFRASLRPIDAWLTFGQRFGLEINALHEALTIILQVKVELPFGYGCCVSSRATRSYANLSNADISLALIENTGANLRGLFSSDVDLQVAELENAIMPDGTPYGAELVTTIR